MTTNQQSRDGLRHVLRELIEGGADPLKATDQALARVPKQKLVAYVRPLVLHEARGLTRALGRNVENEAFAPETGHSKPDDHSRRAGSGATNSDYRQQLVSTRFPLADGTWVAWGQATAKQHLQRAEWQRRHADQSVRDAERHEWAANLIEDRGVECLDEIDGWTDLIDGVE